MKVRGFLIVLMMALVIVYFIYFAKTGGKSNIRTMVDQYAGAKIDLTKVNMEQLGRIILSRLGGEGQVPADLGELQRSQPGVAAGVFDAWGRTLKYEHLSDSGFRLTSAGPDGAFGTADDIVKEF
jgi:hypothetical protein